VLEGGYNHKVLGKNVRAFIDKKARVNIGWTRDVTVNHTDTATLRLLGRFFRKNATVEDVIKGLMDGKTGATLNYYPDTPKVAKLCPKTIIEQLLEKKSLFVLDVINVFPKVLLIILLTLNRLSSVIEDFSGNFKLLVYIKLCVEGRGSIE